MIERLDWFKSRYDINNFFVFGSGSARVYLGEKAQPVCRYCERCAPEVKFNLLAHGIPVQVRNDRNVIGGVAAHRLGYGCVAQAARAFTAQH